VLFFKQWKSTVIINKLAGEVNKKFREDRAYGFETQGGYYGLEDDLTRTAEDNSAIRVTMIRIKPGQP